MTFQAVLGVLSPKFSRLSLLQRAWNPGPALREVLELSAGQN